MTSLSNQTLSEIVTGNFQTARIFEAYGLDFCCKGKRTLRVACAEKQLPMDTIVTELNEVLDTTPDTRDFNNMSLTELAEYIVRVHHSYVKLNMPQILGYVLRVATKHGDRFPYMKDVYTLFAELSEEMTHHMEKEEKVLFPRIKLMELSADERNSMKFLEAPIHVMEEEHDHAGTILEKIRKLTNDYAAPEQACTTFHLSLDSLKSFAQDLHQHVHLENNILFPKAMKLIA